MHSFWTLLKAEFAAEVISKALFSGKFPRAIAWSLILGYFTAKTIYSLLQIFGAIIKLCVPDSFRTRRVLKKAQEICKEFGTIGTILDSPSGKILQISELRAQHSICIQVQRQRFRMYVDFFGAEVPMEYPLIQSFCSQRIELTREFVPYVVQQFHLNFLQGTS
jgi:hypothetical protein